MRDGMNLVAKEYVAAQDPDDPGVLVLSRFAGAAREMTDAVIVNPYSREEMSEALKRALTMERGERIRRWERLIEGVRANDVKVWRDSFVEALKASREPPLPLFPSPIETILREAVGSESAPATGLPRQASPRRARRDRHEARRPPARPQDA
jgi:trehalose-6-phosphate synthase